MVENESSQPVPVWRSRRAQLVLLAFLVCVGAWIRVADLANVDPRSPDEYYYTLQANTLLDHGTADGYRMLFDAFNPDRPSPTRVGYHWLLTTGMKLTGDRTPLTGARLSCLSSVLSLLLLAWIAFRFFPGPAALAATMLYAVFPAELVLARRAWQETLVELLTLAALAIACWVTAGSRNRWLLPVWVATGVLSFTVKEASAAAFLFAAAWILLILCLKREWKTLVIWAGSTLAAALLALGWTAMRLGGLGELHRLSVVTAKVGQLSAYGLQYESGPSWYLLRGFWVLSATTALLALLGIAVLVRLWTRRPRSEETEVRARILLGMTIFTLLLIVLAMVLPERLNYRYICGIFAPMLLLAGVGFDSLLGAVRRFLPATEGATVRVMLGVALLAAAAFDLHTYSAKLTAPWVQDLSIRMVLTAGGVEDLEPIPPVLSEPMTVAPAPASMPAPTQAVPAAQPGIVQPATAQLTAQDWINASASFAQSGRNEDAISAANKALALDPKSAVAWNNIAAANENLRHWDQAIDAANHALALQPDFQLAKNNLVWSLEQKRKQAGQ
ncbi:MAG TPA: glycosyltransferase family 39 protein [Acidobacteriaceae bacterium]